ncbi:MAG: hypothetical protein ACM3XZ_06250 [Betaproteobacteria bacterium]
MASKEPQNVGELAPAAARWALTARGVPVTRGEDFVGLQMTLDLPGQRKSGKKVRTAHGLIHRTCPRCGRYLGAILAGASALCPRCGVWTSGC